MPFKTGFNKLHYYLHNPQQLQNVAFVLGGSAAPALTLQEIISLSSDPETTRAAFSFDDVRLGLGSAQGNETLRRVIAETYETDTARAADIIIAAATTGANHIVHQSLLKHGDHVICQYPIYGPCIEEPLAIGCDVSYLRLNAADDWALDIKQLESLIRPGETKLLMLNNPNNPTGTYLSTALQREIITLAKRYDITVHSDEIFRPLFHDVKDGGSPTSMLDHPDLGYDNVVVTSSLSKVWGLSGVRIGWIGTRSQSLKETFLSYRVMSTMAVSQLDERIAAEVLSPRCRPTILNKHLALARTNIQLLQEFIDANASQIEWVRPTAGAVAFVRFKDYETGKSVDDVEFCRRLQGRKGVVLSPATANFEFGDGIGGLKGRVRMHFTVETEALKSGLRILGEFLEEEKGGSVVNGTT